MEGRPVGEELDRMVDAMEHRGPDGAGTWRDGSVGLGHLMLETTPEDQYESLPLVDRTGNFAITADARIDNRDELIKTLDVREPDDRPITDTELILAAYKRWGRDCPKKLLGAFAFAVWDGQRGQMFCARDHFGVKPLYYSHKSGDFFALTSEISSIFYSGKLDKTENKKRIGDYLSGAFYDESYTFYREVLRVPPSSSLVVSKECLESEQYWSLDLGNAIEMDTDEDYANAFVDIFTDAVRCRMRSSHTVGSFLSGGLDSSAVCSTASSVARREAKWRKIQSFSTVYDQHPECDERQYIKKVADGTSLEHNLINGDGSQIISESQKIMDRNGPFGGPNIGSSAHRYEAARKRGTRVLLDGHGGDEVVSHGYGRLRELAQEGHWVRLFRGLRGMSEGKPNHSPLTLTLGFISKFGRESAPGRRMVPRQLIRYCAGVAHKSIRKAMNAMGINSPRGGVSWKEVIDDDFLERYNFEARKHETQKKRFAPDGLEGSPVRARHYGTLTDNIQTHAFEVFNRVCALHGVEARYPFWDKRLVEFCLSLPSDQRLRDGWGRFIMRQALKNRLPEEVVWRRDKTDFTPVFRDGLLSEKAKLRDLLLDGVSVAEEYLSHEAVAQLYEKVTGSSPSPRELFLAWRVALLISWLRSLSTPGDE